MAGKNYEDIRDFKKNISTGCGILSQFSGIRNLRTKIVFTFLGFSPVVQVGISSSKDIKNFVIFAITHRIAITRQMADKKC